MKKTAAVILALVIALSAMLSLSMATFAANEPAYSVSFNTKEAQQLDVVTMEISIKNNPGLISLRLQVVYDETVLKLVEVKDNGLLNGWTQPAPTVKSPYILRWADPIAPSNNTANGVVAKLTFKVKDGAAFDRTKVTVEHIESRQFDGTKNTFANASAEFTVVCPHSSVKEQVAKQPTHTEVGTKAIVCNTCGKTIRTETVPATGHSFGAWTVTKTATCTAEGAETRTCSCSAKETRKIDKTAHTAGKWEVKTAPTCTEKGAEVQKCTACGTVMATRETAAKGHTFGEWTIVKDATCTEKGEKKSACTVCGNAITEEIPAKGHIPGEWTVTKEPTCTEKGEKSAECTVCGEKYTEEIAAKGHTPSEWTVVKEATCTEDGEKKSVCTVCGEEYTEAIPALDHNYGEWKVVKEATDTAEGQKERVCAVCGEKETEIIPVLTAKPENPQKPEDSQNPDIPNTTENTIVYAVLSVLGVMMIFAIVGVSVYRLRKKQFIHN